MVAAVIDFLLPSWELDKLADAFAPYSRVAFMRLILAPDALLRLIGSDKQEVRGFEAHEVMEQSSAYGYKQFRLDLEGADRQDDTEQARNQRKEAWSVIAMYRRKLHDRQVGSFHPHHLHLLLTISCYSLDSACR